MSNFSIDKIHFFDKSKQQGNTTSFVAMNDEKKDIDIHKAYNANPNGNVSNVTLSNGQPNSVMT